MEKQFLDIPLGDRMKSQEKKFQSYISEKENVIVRLDGDSFSKFTKSFRKPFDSIITDSMNQTTEELFKRFTASFAYTQSDEITLVIPASKELVLGGKVQKLVSLTAGFASTKFNQFLLENIEKEKEELGKSLYKKLLKKVGEAWFDSRVFAFEDLSETFNAVLWRMRDAERNSISMLAYSVFSHNSLLNKNSQEKKEMLSQSGYEWEELEEGLKYGYFFKRETFEKEPGVIRRRIVKSAKKFNYSEENVQLIISKEL